MVDKIGATGDEKKTASAVGHVVQKLTNAFEEPTMAKGLDSYNDGALCMNDGFSNDTTDATDDNTSETPTIPDATDTQAPTTGTPPVEAPKKSKHKQRVGQKNNLAAKEESGLTVWKVVFPFRGLYDFISRKKQKKAATISNQGSV